MTGAPLRSSRRGGQSEPASSSAAALQAMRKPVALPPRNAPASTISRKSRKYFLGRRGKKCPLFPGDIPSKQH
jgi:hypothetical protein